MKYARTYKAVMNRLKKRINREIFLSACHNKLKFTRLEDRDFHWADSFHEAVCDMDYITSGDLGKLTFEQWRIKEIYRWGVCESKMIQWVDLEIWDTREYLVKNKHKLTKEQFRELYRAIDDMNLYGRGGLDDKLKRRGIEDEV